MHKYSKVDLVISTSVNPPMSLQNLIEVTESVFWIEQASNVFNLRKWPVPVPVALEFEIPIRPYMLLTITSVISLSGRHRCTYIPCQFISACWKHYRPERDHNIAHRKTPRWLLR